MSVGNVAIGAQTYVDSQGKVLYIGQEVERWQLLITAKAKPREPYSYAVETLDTKESCLQRLVKLAQNQEHKKTLVVLQCVPVNEAIIYTSPAAQSAIKEKK